MSHRSEVPIHITRKYNPERKDPTQSMEIFLQNKIRDNQVDNEAFWVVDLSQVAKNYYEWKECLPRVTPYFAVKCNPDNAIIELLDNLGAGFDCAGIKENKQVTDLGIDPSRIIFANPCKIKSHIRHAKKKNITKMTFDCEEELYKISELYPEAELVLRIEVDNSQSLIKLTEKYGAKKEATRELLSLAKSLNLNVIGVSFHVGSDCGAAEPYVSAINAARKVFDEAREEGFDLSLLDIGGGWPGVTNCSPSFPEITGTIRPLMDSLFPQEVKIISEPGRWFLRDTHTLAISIHTKKSYIDPVTSEKTFGYYVDDGIFQSFLNHLILPMYQTPPLPLKSSRRDGDEVSYRAKIYGPTCTSLDVIDKDCYLPEMHVDDYLYYPNMGAYWTSLGTQFNGYTSTHKTFFIC